MKLYKTIGIVLVIFGLIGVLSFTTVLVVIYKTPNYIGQYGDQISSEINYKLNTFKTYSNDQLNSLDSTITTLNDVDNTLSGFQNTMYDFESSLNRFDSSLSKLDVYFSKVGIGTFGDTKYNLNLADQSIKKTRYSINTIKFDIGVMGTKMIKFKDDSKFLINGLSLPTINLYPLGEKVKSGIMIVVSYLLFIHLMFLIIGIALLNIEEKKSKAEK